MSAEVKLACPSWASLIPGQLQMAGQVLSVSLAAWVYRPGCRIRYRAVSADVPQVQGTAHHILLHIGWWSRILSLFLTVRAVRLVVE